MMMGLQTSRPTPRYDSSRRSLRTASRSSPRARARPGPTTHRLWGSRDPVPTRTPPSRTARARPEDERGETRPAAFRPGSLLEEHVERRLVRAAHTPLDGVDAATSGRAQE